MPRPCATFCQGPPRWHKVPRHKVTRHKVLAQGCPIKLWRPATNTFHGHEQVMKMMTVLCIIISCVRGTSKTMKMISFRCISYDSETSANFPTTSKIMKMLTVPCISFDSEATRPPLPKT